jgi:hypothetical protein
VQTETAETGFAIIISKGNESSRSTTTLRVNKKNPNPVQEIISANMLSMSATKIIDLLVLHCYTLYGGEGLFINSMLTIHHVGSAEIVNNHLQRHAVTMNRQQHSMKVALCVSDTLQHVGGPNSSQTYRLLRIFYDFEARKPPY